MTWAKLLFLLVWRRGRDSNPRDAIAFSDCHFVSWPNSCSRISRSCARCQQTALQASGRLRRRRRFGFHGASPRWRSRGRCAMKRSKLSKSAPLVRFETNRSGGLRSSAIIRLRVGFDLRDVAPAALTSQDGPIEQRREVPAGKAGGGPIEQRREVPAGKAGGGDGGQLIKVTRFRDWTKRGRPTLAATRSNQILCSAWCRGHSRRR
jgi:hypothetical protein